MFFHVFYFMHRKFKRTEFICNRNVIDNNGLIATMVQESQGNSEP